MGNCVGKPNSCAADAGSSQRSHDLTTLISNDRDERPREKSDSRESQSSNSSSTHAVFRATARPRTSPSQPSISQISTDDEWPREKSGSHESQSSTASPYTIFQTKVIRTNSIRLSTSLSMEKWALVKNLKKLLSKSSWRRFSKAVNNNPPGTASTSNGDNNTCAANVNSRTSQESLDDDFHAYPVPWTAR